MQKTGYIKVKVRESRFLGMDVLSRPGNKIIDSESPDIATAVIADYILFSRLPLLA